MLSVEEFAQRKGIATQRAYALVHAGTVSSQRVGNAIAVDESALGWEPYVSRPLSTRIAWALIDELAGNRPTGLSSSERSRVRRYVDNLRRSDRPDEILRAYLARRAPRQDFRASTEDLEDIRQDHRLVLSGISSSASRMSAPHEVEGYVDPKQQDRFVKDYLLIPVFGEGNVRLRHYPIERADMAVVIADLLDWSRPREKRQATELLERLLHGGTDEDS